MFWRCCCCQPLIELRWRELPLLKPDSEDKSALVREYSADKRHTRYNIQIIGCYEKKVSKWMEPWCCCFNVIWVCFTLVRQQHPLPTDCCNNTFERSDTNTNTNTLLLIIMLIKTTIKTNNNKNNNNVIKCWVLFQHTIRLAHRTLCDAPETFWGCVIGLQQCLDSKEPVFPQTTESY